MTSSAHEAGDEAFATIQKLHASGDIRGAMRQAETLLTVCDSHVGALEYLGTALITRKKAYDDGLVLLDRAVAISPEDPGLWYARGWCYEFVAHEQRRRGHAALPMARSRYLEAATSFRRCLELWPEGKLADDAQDLLDHVESELLGW